MYDIEEVVKIATGNVPIPSLEDAIISFRGRHSRRFTEASEISLCAFEQRDWYLIQDVMYKSAGFFEDFCNVSSEVAALFSAHCCEIVERYEHHLATVASCLRSAHNYVE